MPLQKNTIDLKDMLKGKTVLLLGAGASVDYDFPLWDGLEKEFLFLIDHEKGVSDFSNHEGAEYWRKALAENSTRTVDELAFVASDKGIELFQMMILHVFFNHEASDKRSEKKGWVEKFTTEYLRLLESDLYSNRHLKGLLENLSIISLNYERSFGVRFVSKVEIFLKENYPNTIIREGALQGIDKSFIPIYQPHGSLGNIPSIDSQPGVISEFSHHRSTLAIEQEYGGSFRANLADDKRLPAIMPVDFMQFNQSRNGSYNRANAILAKADNIIIIGMSPTGLNSSFLQLSNQARVLSTGKEPLIDGCTPLGCYANDIVWRVS